MAPRSRPLFTRSSSDGTKLGRISFSRSSSESLSSHAPAVESDHSMMDMRSYTGFNGPADRDGLLSPPDGDGRALDRFERKSTEAGELTTGVETAVDELRSMLDRRLRAILDVAQAHAAEIEQEAEHKARQRKRDAEAAEERLTRLSAHAWPVTARANAAASRPTAGPNDDAAR